MMLMNKKPHLKPQIVVKHVHLSVLLQDEIDHIVETQTIDNRTSAPPANGHIREQVWSRFTYICCELYVQFWKSVHLEAGVTNASPLFSFYTTYNMFTNLWKKAYPVRGVVDISRSTEPVTDDERKAMWYVGGYFIKNLTKKINSKIGSHPKYTHGLLLILESFHETDETVEDDETNDELYIKSKDWFNAINRGELTCCTNKFYNFMINLEKEIKRMLEELDELTTNRQKQSYNSLEIKQVNNMFLGVTQECRRANGYTYRSAASGVY
uniref:Uncharacterized protein n=1 Tax=Amphimedon queenslandica TaxID=400682 RepID=A0A1X7V624_AMPQE